MFKKYMCLVLCLLLALVLVILGGVLQAGNSYLFTDSANPNQTIIDTFGANNTVVVVYPKTEGDDALIEGYEKGERLAYAKFVDMVWFVGNGQGQDVVLKGADGTELVTYNFKHGSVENGMQKFDSYATNLLGTNTSSLSGQNKKAFSETWKIWTGYQDAFIYVHI